MLATNIRVNAPHFVNSPIDINATPQKVSNLYLRLSPPNLLIKKAVNKSQLYTLISMNQLPFTQLQFRILNLQPIKPFSTLHPDTPKKPGKLIPPIT